MSMCVSYGIYLFGLFTFAKIPDNNMNLKTTAYYENFMMDWSDIKLELDINKFIKI